MNRDLAWGIFAALLIVAIAAFALVWLTPPTLAAGLACRGTVGIASWYGTESGSRTASGERFDGTSMTMAVPRRAMMGKTYRVTDMRTGRSVVVRANDLGPAAYLHRVADLSRAAAERLGMIGRGTARACVERIVKPFAYF